MLGVACSYTAHSEPKEDIENFLQHFVQEYEMRESSATYGLGHRARLLHHLPRFRPLKAIQCSNCTDS